MLELNYKLASQTLTSYTVGDFTNINKNHNTVTHISLFFLSFFFFFFGGGWGESAPKTLTIFQLNSLVLF